MKKTKLRIYFEMYLDKPIYTPLKIEKITSEYSNNTILYINNKFIGSINVYPINKRPRYSRNEKIKN